MTRRTWMGCCSGTPPGPGTADTSAAISRARSSVSTSITWKPAAHSLNSWNGPSVTTRPPEASARTMCAASGGVRIVASTSSPLSSELVVERAVVVEVGGDLLRLPLLHGGVVDAGLEGDDEQVPGHGWPLPVDGLGARSRC